MLSKKLRVEDTNEFKKKTEIKEKSDVKKRNNRVSYVCCNCGIEEKIPVKVLEEFDELYPEQLLLYGHKFQYGKYYGCDLIKKALAMYNDIVYNKNELKLNA